MRSFFLPQMHAVEEGLLFLLQVRATRGIRAAVSVPMARRTSCDRPAAQPPIDRLGYSKHDRSFVLMNEGAIDLFLSTADFSQAFWLVPQSTLMGEGRSRFSPTAQQPLIRSDN